MADLSTQVPDEPVPPRSRSGRGRAIGGLAAVNILATALGLLSGPLQARALGPEGRGTLAAILVPVTLAPQLASLGLGAYATREVARGRSVRVVFGSLAVPLLVMSALIMGTSAIVADLIAGGRPLVRHYVQIGLLLSPLGLFSGLLMNIAVGLERWRLLVTARIISPLVWTGGVVALYASGHLDVTSAVIVTLAGSIAAVVPLARLAMTGRPRVERDIIRKGIPFGIKTWLGGLSALANVRLDQLLMARLVDASELGLYVVAVTVATFATSILIGAVTTVIAPRIAAGDSGIAAMASRVTIALMSAMALGLGLVSPFLVPLVFGKGFADAVPLAQVLLVGSVPFTGAYVLGTILVYSNHPGRAASADILAAVLTGIGLILLLPSMGAMGAAIVSFAAYSVSFVLVLIWTSRSLGLRFSDLVVVTRADLAVLWQAARGAVRRSRLNPTPDAVG
ncbi:MAG: oligosaccharide flippase family protein [Acidimicrobiales bacterium]